MKTLIIPLLIIISTSCVPENRVYEETSVIYDRSDSNFSETGDTGGTVDSDIYDFDNGALGNEFSGCDLNSFQFSDFGGVAICQSNTQDTKFKVRFTRTNNGNGTCIIPMNRNQSGGSEYIGIAQCMRHVSGEEVTGNVVKNRTNYESYNINSIMIMDFTTVQPFMICMHAADDFYRDNCQNLNPYSLQLCQQNAIHYKNSLCTQFVQANQGRFLQVDL
jgi:hypothetical protein